MRQFALTSKNKTSARHLLDVSTVASLMLLAACASAPPAPTQALQAAELAISTAEKGRVADYASPELGEARDHLAAANVAVQQENMVVAQRLADLSRADAELASARAEVAKAQAINDEMKKSTNTMNYEMQRNTGIQQ